MTLVTNLKDKNLFEMGSCKRKERKRADVPQPNLIKLYNKKMRGVDLFDKMRGLYRIRIRSRKWYWPYFRFCLNGSIVNLELFYKFVHKKYHCWILQGKLCLLSWQVRTCHLKTVYVPKQKSKCLKPQDLMGKTTR